MKDITIIENVKQRPNLCEKSSCYTVSGEPKPLARPRFANGHVYDCQKILKERVAYELKYQHDYSLPFDGPVKLEATFFMPIPQRLRRKHFIDNYPPHSVKPDIDNLLKLLLDSMNSVIIKDDALVAIIVAQKVYSECPRTELTITRLEINGSKKDLDRKS